MRIPHLLCGCALVFLAPLPVAPLEAAPDLARWSARLSPADARVGEGAAVIVTAQISAPWHLYSTTQPPGGSQRTTIRLLPNAGLQARGKIAQPRPARKFNPAFKITDELYQGAVSFGVPVVLGAKARGARRGVIEVRFQLCSDRLCSPLQTMRVPFSWTPQSGSARAGRRAPIVAAPPQRAQK